MLKRRELKVRRRHESSRRKQRNILINFWFFLMPKLYFFLVQLLKTKCHSQCAVLWTKRSFHAGYLPVLEGFFPS